MPLVVDGGVMTDSDGQWRPRVPTLPSLSTAPDAPATATVPSLSTAPDAPATGTVPSLSTAPDAPATSPARWLECGASGSGDAANQVCCKTGRRKALRLCQLVEVSIYVGPQISGRAVWCHELGCGFFWRSTKYWWAHHGPGVGPIFDSIVERFIPARICSSKSNANAILRAGGAGMAKIPTRPCKWGPELYKGPDWQCCRAQRRLYSPGLPACPRNRGYSRPNGGWREIFAGVRKIAPIGARMGRSKAHCGGRISYTTILCQRPRCPSAVLAVGRCANGAGSSEHYGSGHVDQRLGAGSRQTFCNGPHWDYHPINGDRGVDASKLHPKSKIWEGCPCEDARGSPPDGVHPYVAALQRDASVSPGAAIESIGGRNRGGAQFTGSFVFQALYGDGQIRLRSSIRPSEPLRPRRQQPILAREGPVPGLEPPSGVGVTTMTGPATMSALDNASETGPQRYTGLPLPPPREVGPLPSRDPGFPPPVEGLSLSEQIGRYLSLTSLLSEQMRWYTTRGLVVPEWCARHISLLHHKIHELQQAHHVRRTANRGTSLRCRRNKGPLLDWGLWRMFKPMFGWWKMRNPERDWFLGGLSVR